MRAIIMAAGAVVALGFLIASAIANFLFGASLGRTPWEAQLYGSVGVLAVAMNALAPFYLSWALTGSRRAAAAGVILLWIVCLSYSLTSALGFAAQNRDDVSSAKALAAEAYQDIRREVLELEERLRGVRPKDRPRLQATIDDARMRLTAARGAGPASADAQSAFLATLANGLLNARQVRVALVTLFAVMIELGATLGLFAALSDPMRPRRDTNPSKSAATVSLRWRPGTTHASQS